VISDTQARVAAPATVQIDPFKVMTSAKQPPPSTLQITPSFSERLFPPTASPGRETGASYWPFGFTASALPQSSQGSPHAGGISVAC
jgi:hypothetical protein